MSRKIDPWLVDSPASGRFGTLPPTDNNEHRLEKLFLEGIRQTTLLKVHTLPCVPGILQGPPDLTSATPVRPLL